MITFLAQDVMKTKGTIIRPMNLIGWGTSCTHYLVFSSDLQAIIIFIKIIYKVHKAPNLTADVMGAIKKKLELKYRQIDHKPYAIQDSVE